MLTEREGGFSDTSIIEWTLRPEAAAAADHEDDAGSDGHQGIGEDCGRLQHGVYGPVWWAAFAMTADCVVQWVLWARTLKIVLKTILVIIIFLQHRSP